MDSVGNDNDSVKKKFVIRVEKNRQGRGRPPKNKWKSTGTKERGVDIKMGKNERERYE